MRAAILLRMAPAPIRPAALPGSHDGRAFPKSVHVRHGLPSTRTDAAMVCVAE